MDVKKIIDRAVEEGQVAGINLLVCQHGREVLYYEKGYANLEKKTPYQRDAITRMYSMTKPFTGAAVMKLVEEGELTLGRPVGDIIPSFRDIRVWENGKAVPARHWLVIKSLMGMTSGLAYGGDPTDPASAAVQEVYDDIDRNLTKEGELSTLAVASRLGQGLLAFQPGENWRYGTSADVLGAVVEKVSGMRFGEFLKKEFFDPLGMTDTAFYVPKDKAGRLADAYERTDKGLVFCPTRNLGMTYERAHAPAFESGGAGLCSTIDDYSRFAAMLLNGGSFGGKQILKEETVAYFTNPRMTTLQQDCLWKNWDSLQGYNYGNLLRCCVEPKMSYYLTRAGEYGWDGWLGTFFGNDPANDTTTLITYQLKDAGGYPLNEAIRNALYYEI